MANHLQKEHLPKQPNCLHKALLPDWEKITKFKYISKKGEPGNYHGYVYANDAKGKGSGKQEKPASGGKKKHVEASPLKASSGSDDTKSPKQTKPSTKPNNQKEEPTPETSGGGGNFKNIGSDKGGGPNEPPSEPPLGSSSGGDGDKDPLRNALTPLASHFDFEAIRSIADLKANPDMKLISSEGANAEVYFHEGEPPFVIKFGSVTRTEVEMAIKLHQEFPAFIPAVYDFREGSPTGILAMENAGNSLQELQNKQRRKEITKQELVRATDRITLLAHEAMKQLHLAGFSHNDGHDGNVTLSDDDSLRMIDFSSVKISHKEAFREALGDGFAQNHQSNRLKRYLSKGIPAKKDKSNPLNAGARASAYQQNKLSPKQKEEPSSLDRYAALIQEYWLYLSNPGEQSYQQHTKVFYDKLDEILEQHVRS